MLSFFTSSTFAIVGAAPCTGTAVIEELVEVVAISGTGIVVVPVGTIDTGAMLIANDVEDKGSIGRA